MSLLPFLVQVICLVLDAYLIVKLPGGMPRKYLIFSLARSVIRVYAQWFLSLGMWANIYWWGEILGYMVVVTLIASLTHPLVTHHVNTATFYTLMVMAFLVVAVWHMPKHPLEFSALAQLGSTAVLMSGFMLLMGLILGNTWGPQTRWIGWGVTFNLGSQFIATQLERVVGPTLQVSLVHQMGFLLLQGCWLIAVGHGELRKSEALYLP